MAPLHAKSPCCGALVRRRGRRRRQCINCKRTWSIRKKKCGRKRTRHTKALLKRILIDGHTLAQEARNFHALKSVSVAARFATALRTSVSAPPPRLPKGPYALVVDGVYFKFQRKEWVLYLMALKPIRSKRMYFLDSVLIKGRERLEAWEQAVDTIPPDARKRITALVSDGLRGIPGSCCSECMDTPAVPLPPLSITGAGQGKATIPYQRQSDARPCTQGSTYHVC